jgi:hypothetical protein
MVCRRQTAVALLISIPAWWTTDIAANDRRGALPFNN